MNVRTRWRHLFLQNRRQNALLVLSSIATLGTYFIIPFLTVYLVREGGLSAALAGAVLSTYLISSRALMFLAGTVSDQIGAKITMIIGLTLSGVSYGGLVVANSFWQYCAVALVSGTGVALFQPSSKSLFIAGTSPERVNVAFAWRGAAANLGVALGGVLASVSLTYTSFKGLFLISMAIYLAMVLSLCMFRFDGPAQVGSGVRVWESLQAALTHKDLLIMLILSAGFWILYTQLTVTVPLALNSVGLAQAIGLVFAINAILIVFVQVPLSSMVTNTIHMSPKRQFSLGVLAIGVGLACMSFITLGWPALIAFILLFTAGEMLAVPNLDAIPALLAKDKHMGTYLGVSASGGAVGSGIGAAGGGTLFTQAETAGTPALTWVLCGAIALIVVFGTSVFLQRRDENNVQGEV